MVQQAADNMVLEQWVREYENDATFIAQDLASDVIDEAVGFLKARGLNQSQLADTMGVSRSYVSNLFNAPPNLTLLSIARLAVALGTKPKILLDGNTFFVRSLNQHFDYEDFTTEQTFLRKQAALGNTLMASDVVISPRIGVGTSAA